VPATADSHPLDHFVLPEFIFRFLPDSKKTDSSLDDRHFSRKRRLTLEITIALLINMVRPGKRDGYQKVIDRFFSDTALAFEEDTCTKPPDKAAFCRARKKIPVSIFEGLFDKATRVAETLADPQTSLRWKGFRVFAIDGTKKNLPDTPSLRAYFEAPAGAHFPQMITCALFNVLAKIPINFIRGPFWTPERVMAKELINDLGLGDLLLLDRGFPSYELFFEMLQQGIDFLVRLPKDGMFKEVTQLLACGKRDGKITLSPPKALLKEHPNQTFPTLTLRVVRLSVPGTKEPLILITTLLNRKKYLPSELRELYHLRWNEEEFFKTIKEHLEAEQFHGKCVQFIDQELIAVYLYYSLSRIMIMETSISHEIPLENIEIKAALLAVSRYLDRLWLATSVEHCENLLKRCIAEISWRRYRPRPGRKYPRKSKSHRGKWALKWT
jgi:hypothetical protein